MNKHHNEWQNSLLHEVTPICLSIATSLSLNLIHSQHSFTQQTTSKASSCWAEAPIKIARMTLTIKLDGNWSSFQLANSAPPLSVTDSAIAPSARMHSEWQFWIMLNPIIQSWWVDSRSSRLSRFCAGLSRFVSRLSRFCARLLRFVLRLSRILPDCLKSGFALSYRA